MASGHNVETEIINPRQPDKPLGDVIKEYLDKNHAKGWELVNFLPLFDNIVFIWRKPARETRAPEKRAS